MERIVVVLRGALVAPILLLALGGCLPGCGPEPDDRPPERVRVAILPHESEARLRVRFEPLLEYLATATGLELELNIPVDYEVLVDRFQAGEYDLALFGGVTFVQARSRAGAVPLVSRDIDLEFTSSFVVRSEASESSIEAFRGRSLAFGPRFSTSGHLIPRRFLANRGIELEEFFGEIHYASEHDHTLRLVEDGSAAVGAVDSAVLASMLRDGSLERNALHVIAVTPPFTNYVWAVTRTLDRDTRKSILEAFLQLDPNVTEHAKLLAAQEAGGFLPVGPGDFEEIRDAALAAGLL